MQIQCSNCGAISHFRYCTGNVLCTVVVRGWNSFGSALYCPKCSETWHERNGPDKPLAGREKTIALIDAIHQKERRPRRV